MPDSVSHVSNPNLILSAPVSNLLERVSDVIKKSFGTRDVAVDTKVSKQGPDTTLYRRFEVGNNVNHAMVRVKDNEICVFYYSHTNVEQDPVFQHMKINSLCEGIVALEHGSLMYPCTTTDALAKLELGIARI